MPAYCILRLRIGLGNHDADTRGRNKRRTRPRPRQERTTRTNNAREGAASLSRKSPSLCRATIENLRLTATETATATVPPLTQTTHPPGPHHLSSQDPATLPPTLGASHTLPSLPRVSSHLQNHSLGALFRHQSPWPPAFWVFSGQPWSVQPFTLRAAFPFTGLLRPSSRKVFSLCLLFGKPCRGCVPACPPPSLLH